MKNFFKLIAFAFVFLANFNGFAEAQTSIITNPAPVTANDNQSSAIAVTNVFQPVFAASTNTKGRVACTIQNTGSNYMYVYFGINMTSVLAEASVAKSVKLSSGQAVTCNSDDIVIKTPVWITGTATDTYYAAQQ